ncbi:MAG TPA: hypothetical protein VJA22_02400 [Patescibacteria group bacterium]|nr:hypothetical protein [Patescibacteria group bacterium]
MTLKKSKQITKRATPERFYRKVVLSFITLALMLIVIIIYFSVISVHILLYPEVKIESLETIVDVEPGDVDEQTTDNFLFAHFFDKEFHESSEFQATGTSVVNDGKLGSVVIINDSSRAQPLVRQTRLANEEGIMVRISESVNVPANGQVEVEVYPHEDDEDYFNSGKGISAETKLEVVALNDARKETVYALAKTDIAYVGKEVPSVSEQDISKAKQDLSNMVLAKAELEYKQSVKFDGTQHVALVESQEIEFSPSVQSGEQVAGFTASLKMRVYGIVINKKHLITLSGKLLSATLPPDKELSTLDSSTLIFSLEKFDTVAQLANVKTSITGESSLKITDNITDKSRIVGMNKRDLINYYAQFENIKRIEIRFFPFWIAKVPKQTDHIEILIKK